MPSTNQSGGRDVAQFDNIVDDIGHNPARFLDWRLVGPSVDQGCRMLLKARIRGIDRIAVLRAYEAVERNPRVGPTDGPREKVLDWLQEREAELEEIGERPDRIEFGPRRPPEMFDSTSTAPQRERSALDKLQSRRVATDGGESRD